MLYILLKIKAQVELLLATPNHTQYIEVRDQIIELLRDNLVAELVSMGSSSNVYLTYLLLPIYRKWSI